MAELSERDAGLLLDMLLAARDARAFIAGMDEAGFLASRLHQNAVIRSLEIIGEAAGKVSAETQAAHGEIAWREMTGMRAVNDWIISLGLAPGELAYDYSDEASGQQVAIFDLVWRDGLQPGLSAPVALLMDEPENVLELANRAGLRWRRA